MGGGGGGGEGGRYMECYGRVANHPQGICAAGGRYLDPAESTKAPIQIEHWLESGIR